MWKDVNKYSKWKLDMMILNLKIYLMCVGGWCFWTNMAILLSFLFCLPLIWMYFFLFLSNLLFLVLSCVCLCQCHSLSMFVSTCASVLCVWVFFLLSFSLLPFCHWPLLSPPSVKTPQEHHPVKFLLPANLLLLPLLFTRDSKRLLTLSSFVLLIICSHYCCIRLVLFSMSQKTLLNTAIILLVFDFCLIWCPLLLLLLQKVHN